MMKSFQYKECYQGYFGRLEYVPQDNNDFHDLVLGCIGHKYWGMTPPDSLTLLADLEKYVHDPDRNDKYIIPEQLQLDCSEREMQQLHLVSFF